MRMIQSSSEIHLPKKAIDFVLVNYEREKKKFDINAFGLTVRERTEGFYPIKNGEVFIKLQTFIG
jgi:hypothetical protein